jgi:hypothetical protein
MNTTTAVIEWTKPYYGVTHGSTGDGVKVPWATVTDRGTWAEMTKHHHLVPIGQRETTQHGSVDEAKAAGEAWLQSLHCAAY